MEVKILSFSDKAQWLDDFENIRKRILSGNDRLKNNYDEKNLDLDQQEEASIVWDGGIIAFSFLQHRKFWGNISRALGRYYIVPERRSGFFRSGRGITEMMLEAQIFAARRMEKDFIFVSREYPSIKWQKNFIGVHPGWRSLPEYLHQVCKGNVMSCWQHCPHLPMSNKDGEFPLPKRLVVDVIDEFARQQT